MASYYVKNGGDDLLDGLSDANAWETLEYAHSQAIAGDLIFLKRGSSWFGFTPQMAGSSGNPIIFNAYGTGAKPVIHGFKDLSGWASLGAGLWSLTDLDLPSRTHFLDIDNSLSTVARLPRQNYYQITGATGSETGTITDSVNLGGNNYVGGEVVTRKTAWVIDTMTITAHSTNTITYEGGSFYNTQVDWGYCIQNHRDLCTVEFDWCQEGDDIVIYMDSLNPNSYNFKAPVLEKINFNNCGFNDFFNIEFKGFNGGVGRDNNQPCFLYNLSQDVRFLDGCEFNQMGNTVHHFEATNNSGFTLDNCTFSECLNMAFWNRYSSTTPEVTITNCEFTNIGHILGAGGNADNGYKCIQFAGSTDPATMTGNRMTNIGYCGFDYGGYSYLIENNYVKNSCMIKADGGAYYTYGKGDAGKTYVKANRIIRNNIAIDCPGNAWGTSTQFSSGNPTAYFSEGYYFDDVSSKITVQGNLAVRCRAGLKLQNGQDIDLLNNTFYNNYIVQALLASNNNGDIGPVRNAIENLTFTGNTLYSKSGQTVLQVESNEDDFDIMGTFDNNYYMRPANEAGIIRYWYNTGGGFDNGISLAQWKTTDLGTGFFQDANTVGTPTTSTISNLYFNDTFNNEVSIDIGRRRMDIDGVTITSLTLDSFEFSLLLDDLGPIIILPPPTNMANGIRFGSPVTRYGSELWDTYTRAKTDGATFELSLMTIEPIKNQLIGFSWNMLNIPFCSLTDQVYSLIGTDLTLTGTIYTATALINIATPYSLFEIRNGENILKYVEPGPGTLKTYIDGAYIGSEAFTPVTDYEADEGADTVTAMAYYSGTLTEQQRIDRTS